MPLGKKTSFRNQIWRQWHWQPEFPFIKHVQRWICSRLDYFRQNWTGSYAEIVISEFDRLSHESFGFEVFCSNKCLFVDSLSRNWSDVKALTPPANCFLISNKISSHRHGFDSLEFATVQVIWYVGDVPGTLLYWEIVFVSCESF